MVKGTPAFTAWRPRSRYRGSASGAGWTSWSWKTIDSPGYAPSPLPLTHEPRYTPPRSTGTVPTELMQSTASLMSLAAQRSFSISRSLSTPVDVSQWTAQSQFAHAARSSAASIRSRPTGSPQSTRRTSNLSSIRRAWSTSLSPNSPLLTTSPPPGSNESWPAIVSLAIVPEPRSISVCLEPTSRERRPFTRSMSATNPGARCETGSLANALPDLGADADGSWQQIYEVSRRGRHRPGTEVRREVILQGGELAVHRLVQSLVRSYLRSKGNEPQPPVHPLLHYIARDYGDVVSAVQTVPCQRGQQPLENPAMAVLFPYRQQPYLADGPAGRQIGVEMLKLLVQREGVSASGRHHSNQLPGSTRVEESPAVID